MRSAADLSFGDFLLRTARRELLRGGEPVTVQPKVFELIALLVAERARVLDKNELLDRLWPGQVVTEAALTRAVMKARRALDDDADNPRMILNVHGRGYRFVAAVVDVDPDATPAPTAAVEDPAPPPAAATAAPAAVETRKVRQLLLSLLATAALLTTLFWLWRSERAWLPLPGSDSVRLAILPLDNATGDPAHDWASLGLMQALGEVLQAAPRVQVLPASDILGYLDGRDARADPALAGALGETFALDYRIEGRIEAGPGQLRLLYAWVDRDGRRRERTVTGASVQALAQAAGADLRISLGQATGADEFGADAFASEAYLRGRARWLQGDLEGAVALYRLAAEQAPQAFWPRLALANAERERGETAAAAARYAALYDEAERRGDPAARIAVRDSWAILAGLAGERELERRLLDEALQLARGRGPAAVADIEASLGFRALSLGDNPAARRHLQDAIAAGAAAGLPRPPPRVLFSLAQVALAEGQLGEAEGHLQDAIAQARLIGNRRNEAIYLNTLSRLRYRQGRFTEARDLLEEVVALHRQYGNPRAEASALIALAAAEAQLGQLRRGVDAANAALAVAEAIPLPGSVARALSLRGQIRIDLDEIDGALADLAAAEDAASRAGEPELQWRQALHRGRARLQVGDAGGARDEAGAVLAVAGTFPELALDARLLLARAALADGDAVAATARLDEVEAALAGRDEPRRLAWLRLRQAEAALLGADLARARSQLEAARDQLGEEPDWLLARAALAEARGDLAAALGDTRQARARAGEAWHRERQALLARREARAEHR